LLEQHGSAEINGKSGSISLTIAFFRVRSLKRSTAESTMSSTDSGVRRSSTLEDSKRVTESRLWISRLNRSPSLTSERNTSSAALGSISPVRPINAAPAAIMVANGVLRS